MDKNLQANGRPMSKVSSVWLAILLVANLTIVVWMFGTSSAAGVDAQPQSQSSQVEPTLRLLTELSAQEFQQAVRSKHKEDHPPEPITNDDGSLGLQAAGSGEDRYIAATDPLVCRIWGPIAEESTLTGLRASIEKMGDVIEVQETEVQSDPDYLVYLDADGNIDNARRLVKELAGQSIDAYIIAGGELVNSVSVGVFSRSGRAENQRQRIEALGYEPVVEALSRIQTVYHLIGRVPASFHDPDQVSSDCAAIASIQ